MSLQFNKKECLKLFKLQEDLKKKGKSLKQYDKIKYNEFWSYRTLITDYCFWKNREQYKKILDLFVNKKITIEQFLPQFFQLFRSNLNLDQMWESELTKEALGVYSGSTKRRFPFDSKSAGFSQIISELQSLFELHNSDVTLEMNLENPDLIFDGMSEEFLRLIIEENYLPKLEKYT